LAVKSSGPRGHRTSDTPIGGCPVCPIPCPKTMSYQCPVLSRMSYLVIIRELNPRQGTVRVKGIRGYRTSNRTPMEANTQPSPSPSPSRNKARLRNLRRRLPAPAKGRGRLQVQIRRAFVGRPMLSSSQVYDTCYARQRVFGQRLGQMERWSVIRILREIAEPVGRAPTIGRPWLWRLRPEYRAVAG
jgi:hypothetical protein